MTATSAPERGAVLALLARLVPPEHACGARFLIVNSIGAWADGGWSAGDDVGLRAVYVLPTADYLGIRSFCDEYEQVERADDDWTVDLVALEVEKVARLILKGHEPTLAWLVDSSSELISVPGAERLCDLARARHAQMNAATEARPPPPASGELYDQLDDLVRAARLGVLASAETLGGRRRSMA